MGAGHSEQPITAQMPAAALRRALKELGACAKHIASKSPAPITATFAELQIGVGTASDWIAWASRLRELDFATSIKRGSPRARSYLESTRFTYTWTAANALFGRDEVLRPVVSGTPPGGELARFRAIYALAALTSAEETAYLAPLHTTLSLTRVTNAFPWATLPAVRVIDLIYYKYTPSGYRTKGDAARAIANVATGKKTVSSLDLPTLIYATRNWTVHGALLDSSFRGAPQQYQLYITTITKSLADVLGRFGAVLRAAT